MYLILITILVILTGIFIIFNKELFTNNNNKDKSEPELQTMHTLTNDEVEFVKFLVQNILEKLNQKYARNLSLGSLEEVEKSKSQSFENTNYKVTLFINNNKKFNTQKYVFKFVLSDSGTILVTDIKIAGSLNYVMEKVPISERDSTLYKPESNLPPKASDSQTDLLYKTVNKEITKDTNNKAIDPLERNKTILPKEAEYLKNINYRPFPARKIDFIWDKKACSPIECPNKDTKGEFHGRVQGKIYPNYNPTIFLGDSVESDWLFDVGADSASRPIGVTGARGN
jgi:hypothetical protein